MAAGTKGIRAGKAYVELFADNSKLVRGLRLAEKKLRAFGDRVGQLGKKLLQISSVAVLPMAAGAKVFADFERQMANVSTMLDDPTAHMDRFRQAIRQMAVEFGESTETLAGGLYDILSASVSPARALDVLTVAVKAAKGGMTDTKTAADAITTVLNAYSLSADRAADVSDLLFSIVKRGKTTFGQLAPSIGNVVTIAASAGVSFEELGAALAVMTRSGVQTDNAITALNAIISSFLKPSAEGATYARQLGFELSSATIQAEGLAGVFRRIAGLPPDAISNLFPNVRALKGVLPALQNISGFTEDMAIMAQRTGAANTAYEKMAGTLAESFKRVKQAGLLVLSVVGESLADSLKKVSDRIVKLARMVAELVSKNRDLVVAVAKVIAVVAVAGVALVTLGLTIKALAVGFGGVAAVVGVFGKVFRLVTTVLSLVLSPLGLVIAAVTALGGVLLYFTGAGGAAVDWLKDKFQTLKKEMTTALGGIADALAAGDISLAARILWLTLKMQWQKGVNFLQDTWLRFKDFFLRIAYGAFYGVQAVWENVVHAITVGWIEGVAAMQKAWAHFSAWHAGAVENTAQWIAKKWLWLQSKFDDSIDLNFATKYLEQESQQQFDKIAADRQQALNEAEGQRVSMHQAAQQEHQQNLTQIGQAYEQQSQQVQNQHDQRMRQAEAELAQARQEWTDAIAAARQKRQAQAEGGPDKPSGIEELIGKVQSALKGVGDLVAQRAITVTGTFNAAEVSRFGAGGPAERTAVAAEETARNTRKLVDAAKNGGVTFT